MTRRFLHNAPWSSLLDACSEAHPSMPSHHHVRDDRPPSKQAARRAHPNSAVASAACLEGRPLPVTPSTEFGSASPPFSGPPSRFFGWRVGRCAAQPVVMDTKTDSIASSAEALRYPWENHPGHDQVVEVAPGVLWARLK